MAIYSNEQLATAGTQLAEYMRQLQQRVETVEAKPNLDRMNEEWSQGRAIANRKGYYGADLDQLESEMQRRGLWSHADAIKLDVAPPSGNSFVAGVPDSAFKKLLDGDDQGYLREMIPRALRGE